MAVLVVATVTVFAALAALTVADPTVAAVDADLSPISAPVLATVAVVETTAPAADTPALATSAVVFTTEQPAPANAIDNAKTKQVIRCNELMRSS